MPDNYIEGNKTQVLHILGAPGIGGIEKLTLDLSIVQNRDKSIDTGIYFTFSDHAADFQPAFENSGTQIYYGNFTGGFDVSIVKIIRTFQIFNKFQLLHFHIFNPVIAFLAVLAGKTIVFTDHGTHGRGRTLRAREKLNFRFERYFLNRFVASVTFNSKFTESESRLMFGLENVDGNLIYNGVSGEDASANEAAIDVGTARRLEGKFVVGTSSRFAAFKRIDRLIDAFSIFQRGKDVVLLLVGNGPEMLRLEQRVKNNNLADKVVFTGFRTNVGAYQAAMDVCVFPSEGEPFGLVSIETLLLGKPVIVFSDGGGIVEIVEGVSGDDIVVDSDALSKRLSFYFELGNLSDIEKSRRSAYAEKFSVDAMAADFKDLYASVLP